MTSSTNQMRLTAILDEASLRVAFAMVDSDEASLSELPSALTAMH